MNSAPSPGLTASEPTSVPRRSSGPRRTSDEASRTPPQPARQQGDVCRGAFSGGRRGQREREGLAVGAGPQRVTGADRLLEARATPDRWTPGPTTRAAASGRPTTRQSRTAVFGVAALIARACTAAGSENVPLTRWPVATLDAVGDDSVASPAVEITFAVGSRRVVLRHARRERAEASPVCRASAPASPAPCRPRRRRRTSSSRPRAARGPARSTARRPGWSCPRGS